MGKEAARAVRARQRKTAARVERLIANRDAAGPVDPVGVGRRRRLTAAIREGRRALRARHAARAAIHDAEARAGAALRAITAEGLSLRAAVDAVGVSKSVGRRLSEAAHTTRRTNPTWSTAPTGQNADCASTAHRESGATAIGGAMAKGSP